MNEELTAEDWQEIKHHFRNRKSHFELTVEEQPIFWKDGRKHRILKKSHKEKLDSSDPLPDESDGYDIFNYKYEIISENPRRLKINCSGYLDVIYWFQDQVNIGFLNADHYKISAKTFLYDTVKSFMSDYQIIAYKNRRERAQLGKTAGYCRSCKLPFLDVNFVRKHIHNKHFPQFKYFMIENLPGDAKRSPELIHYLIQTFFISFM